MNPLCVVSEKYKYIYVLLPKSASSTLRHEFKDKRYGPGYEVHYSSLDVKKKQEYFTFTVLREPVTRFLSAYQEVSMRIEGGSIDCADYDFIRLDDTEHRLNEFLNTICLDQWDVHIEKISEAIKHIHFDYFSGIEWLQQDMQVIYSHLGMGDCPLLPKLNSRLGRQQTNGYKKYLWNKEELSEQTINRIISLYREDVELYRKEIIDRNAVENSVLDRLLESAGKVKRLFIPE